MTRSVRLALILFVVAAALVSHGSAEDKPHSNRLAKETSPYLLLHAHNPVDWYPWGPEALERAKREKKPIFLSIGYSSCYWCHVMERESFMNDEIAAKLNANFVCIKVDREERPDIDEIYMQALHAYLQLVGSKQGGGWPLSMFLTPDAKPLMGGTYFPPHDKDGMLGFSTVLDRVLEAWKADPAKWQKTGDALAGYVNESLKQQPILRVVKLDERLFDGVTDALSAQFDSEYGGFGFNPENPKQAKFPEPPNLRLLIETVRRGKSGQVDKARADAAARMLALTLGKVAEGGIRDHVGGGFHRYSTDRYWRVPHFEKMLYDNGQLLRVYALAYELDPRDEYRFAAEEIVEFTQREMQDPGGAYYSALDAETDGEEGRFYVWDRAEVEQALTPEEFQLFAGVYGLDGEPNFEGRYIPLLKAPLATTAQSRDLKEDALNAKLKPIRQRLLDVRNKRERPLTDTKILTGWNGLMIAGLAEAGRVFKQPAYAQAAAKAAEFVLAKLQDDQGQLLRTYGGGEAKIPGYLDDYAFLTDGLIALHRTTGEQKWLDAAAKLMEQQLALFWDEQTGGFFYTSSRHEELFARSKMQLDGVTPAGNSVSAANLLYLAEALMKPEYAERAQGCLRSASPILDEHPAAVPQLAVALAAWIDRPGAAEKPKPQR